MTSLKLVEAISHPCKVTNEDLFDYNARAAWIFDGASGIGPKVIPSSPSDPFWLVQSMNAAIKRRWHDEKSTPDLLTEAADDVIESFLQIAQDPVPPMIDRPTACWLMARLWDGQLELSAVGDCCLVHKGLNGTTSFGGKISDELAAPVRQELKRLKAEGVDAGKLADLLRPLEREFRAKANVDGGYAIVDLTQRWISRIEQSRVLISPGDHILLMTDGLYRLIDTFHKYDTDGLLEAALLMGLSPLYEELRALELHDEDCATFPRAKAQDDVAAALMAIGV